MPRNAELDDLSPRYRDQARQKLADQNAPKTRGKPEAKFMKRVIDHATALGYLVFHSGDSRRDAGNKGFPDLVLVGTKQRSGRLYFIELKAGKNTLEPEQTQWLEALQACGVEVLCVHEDSEEELREMLT